MSNIELAGTYEATAVNEINTVAGRLNAMADMAMATAVEDEDGLIEATRMIDTLQSTTTLVDSIIEPFRARAYEHYQGVLADKKTITGRAKLSIAFLKGQVGEYRTQTQIALREAQRAAVADGDTKQLVVAEKEAALTENVGVGYREHWKAECVDIVALCRAVGDEKAPERLVTFNQSEGNKLARSLRELTGNVPGLRAYKETRVVRQ